MESAPVNVIPQLIKSSSVYKLIVPEDVEAKIRYLINKFPHTEWSGILFYSYSGSFEDGSLVITCKDIYPMDLGSAGFTSFQMSPDVASYIAQNPELFNCSMGLVHSHHNMGAFFSQTDIGTLRSEGNDTTCFVSLIVDTQGTYTAAITRKVSETVMTVVTVGPSTYEFFGEGTKKTSKDNTTKSKAEKTQYIEYFELKVERHANNPLSYLDDRFDEIEKAKNEKKNREEFLQNKNIDISSFPSSDGNNVFYPHKTESTAPIDRFLFSSDVMKGLEKGFSLDPKVIHSTVCKMITGSFILRTDNFDLGYWIKNYMEKAYQKNFFDDLQIQEYIEFVVENVVYHYTDSKIEYSNNAEMDSTVVSKVAEAMANELAPYLGVNAYIDKFVRELENLM